MNQVKANLARIPALNFHVWQPCNMACRYCFAQFKDVRPLLRAEKPRLREHALAVVRSAAASGIEKITFVGGEPTLCPWLGDLLIESKRLGLVTMLVTNGTRLDGDWLDRYGSATDWVALSVDSLSTETNRRIGRVVAPRLVAGEAFYMELVERLVRAGNRLKLNTVVSSANWQEDFTTFLMQAKPERWKVLKALAIQGQNDKAFPELAVTDKQFHAFVNRHSSIGPSFGMVAEDNEAMVDSYLMADPAGRFFSNAEGFYRYSEPIWRVGWDVALSQVAPDIGKFEARGGRYEWY
jgi:radical S-adenosyl methionine domain-containing protein 2